jgi:RNA-directed DNA polymerase
MRNSSFCEKTVRPRPRRLADWLNPMGLRKVHTLVDKVYQMKNFVMAWEKVKANGGGGGIDGQSIEEFEQVREQELQRLHESLKTRAFKILCQLTAS